MNARLAYWRDRLLELDRLLRGDATREEGLQQVSVRGLALLIVALAAFYGACMGSYSLLKATPAGLDDPFGPWLQVVASSVKTPALFLLTLVVTLPSLYVSNALIGSRLTVRDLARLLVASLGVNLAVLASLGTIVLFFSLTTSSYPFVVLLNVAAFSVAGVLGLMFLLQTLHRVLTPDESAMWDELRRTQAPEPAIADEEGDEPPTPEVENDERAGPLDMPAGQVLSRHTRLVFRCWLVLFSLVGAQMGWVLRPFIGNPDQPFTLFRDRDSNFFESVLGSLWNLLVGGG